MIGELIMNKQDAENLTGITGLPEGWDFMEVRRFGKLAGFFCFKENEIHAYRLPEYEGRWLTRHDIEAVSSPLIARFGEVVTTVRSGNEAGNRFVTRLGFEPTHEANGLIYYRTTRLNHARY